MNANATTALETVLKNSAERPLLSMIVADRAVCRVKCSVVRAWSSRWSPLTANPRSPASGRPDCPAAGTFAIAPPHDSGWIHRSLVVLKHALRGDLVKSRRRGGGRLRPRNDQHLGLEGGRHARWSRVWTDRLPSQGSNLSSPSPPVLVADD